MKYSDYLNLEEKLSEQSFNSSYKNVNILLNIFSYLGNFISIFLSFFFLFNILSIGITNIYVCGIICLLLLSGLELFKRDIFKKFSYAFLKKTDNIKSYLVLGIFSLGIIFMSFYSSLHGAKLFASKNEAIELNKEESIKTYSDSLNKIYVVKNESIEKEISTYKNKLDFKDKEQYEINKKLQENSNLSKSEKERNRQLIDEKKELNNSILLNTNLVKSNNRERDSLIKGYSKEINSKSNKALTKNSSDSVVFIFVSTIIELLILFGVYFSAYYNLKSYNDFKKAIEYDPNFQKWFLYNQLLTIIYPADIKINQRIPTLNNIIDLCKINNIYADKKEIEGFLKLSENIGLLYKKGPYRYIMKQYDISHEILKNYFKIK